MKKNVLLSLLIAVSVLLSAVLTSCSLTSLIPGLDDLSLGGGGDTDTSVPAGSLKEMKWPDSVYSKLGVNEIPTSGKLVFTQLGNTEGSYQYELYYDDVTREELVSWVNSMLDKGLRISDDDKERIEHSTWDYDVMLYAANEKQPYRVRIGFQFGDDKMTTEYYADDNPNGYIIHQEEDDGEVYQYIQYNLIISLNPMETATDFSTTYETFGLKAEDLKLNDNVRAVKMGEGSFMSSISILFYTDHVATEEEFKGCRDLLVDKLAANGATFVPMIQDKEITPAELKENNYNSYYVVMNEKTYLFMLDSDSTYDDFGSYYQVVISEVKK